MSDHFLPTPALANTTSGLPTYLGGLAAAGAKRGVPMQWCMPTTGIVLFASGQKAVSNARATVDYAVEDEIANWRENYAVGGPGLIFWAAGVPPSKDITWTTAREPTCPLPTKCHAHPSFEMDVALAVLTTGPVGLGDGPGMTNASLAARTCRADGTLLKPSKPLTAIDATFVPRGAKSGPLPTVGFLPLPKGSPDCAGPGKGRPCSPKAYQTHSAIALAPPAYAQAVKSTAAVWHQLVTIHLGSFTPAVADFYPALGPGGGGTGSPQSVAAYREYRWAPCAPGAGTFGPCLKNAWPAGLPDVSSGPTRFDANNATAWKLFTFFPPLPLPKGKGKGAWILLGELDKIVPVSPQRFAEVGVDAAGCVAWRMQGQKGEAVRVHAVPPGPGKHVVGTFDGAQCPPGGPNSCTLCSKKSD